MLVFKPTKYQKGVISLSNTLSHTKWNCKYHIVFIPKYIRKVIYNKLRTDIRGYIQDLCRWKGVEIVEKEKQELAEKLLYGEIGTSELNDIEVNEMTQYFINDIKDIDAELYKIKQYILYMKKKIEQKK